MKRKRNIQVRYNGARVFSPLLRFSTDRLSDHWVLAGNPGDFKPPFCEFLQTKSVGCAVRNHFSGLKCMGYHSSHSPHHGRTAAAKWFGGSALPSHFRDVIPAFIFVSNRLLSQFRSGYRPDRSRLGNLFFLTTETA